MKRVFILFIVIVVSHSLLFADTDQELKKQHQDMMLKFNDTDLLSANHSFISYKNIKFSVFSQLSKHSAFSKIGKDSLYSTLEIDINAGISMQQKIKYMHTAEISSCDFTVALKNGSLDLKINSTNKVSKKKLLMFLYSKIVPEIFYAMTNKDGFAANLIKTLLAFTSCVEDRNIATSSTQRATQLSSPLPTQSFRVEVRPRNQPSSFTFAINGGIAVSVVSVEIDNTFPLHPDVFVVNFLPRIVAGGTVLQVINGVGFRNPDPGSDAVVRATIKVAVDPR